MRFNCGLSADERQTRDWVELQELIKIRSNWHSWFAWYPVKPKSHDCRWLETVERRAIYNYFGWEYKWVYRPIGEPKYLGAK